MESSSHVLIRPRVPDDDSRIVEMRRKINPDRPPMSIEEFRYSIASQPPDVFFEHVVAEIDGRVQGYATLYREIYVKSQSSFRTFLFVDREMWGQGIGSRLWHHILRSAQEQGASRLGTRVREDLPEAQEFARRREFEPTGRADRMSRLPVASANLDGCRRGLERAQKAGIRIATLAELGTDEALLRAIHRVDDESARDIPSSQEWSSSPFEQWRAEAVDSPSVSPDSFWVAMHGEEPAGLALLEMRSDGNAINGYTGVARRYRGQGVARALKLRTVEWAAERGVPYIYTGNDVDNKPMLAINIDMGYQPLPANVEFVRTKI